MIKDKKITIFIGNMGSGKSEIAINYTLQLMKTQSRPVKLMDLDVIKPYIRIRDVAENLEKQGISLLLPDKKVRGADMPIIPSQIMRYFYDDSFDMVMDVGGEDRGSITIAQFKDQFNDMQVEAYVVINAMRPFSDTPGRIVECMKELSFLSKLSFSGIVANSHIRLGTTIKDILKGTAIIKDASKISQIPLFKIAVWEKLREEYEKTELEPDKMLPIKLHLLFPWEKIS